ncbi:heavy metal translocating P-type ATPase [Candidatus Thioglobus sp.]|jgi:Cu2+-exporting ATPase|uniref:heavy metal translocating P-type ATPase n=1 Tax=Candidatus Thioglobus sp. TaxID=2026721 RepID=UPI003241BE49
MNDTCYHCSLPVTNSNKVQITIKDSVQDFCCAGCASVCQTIHEAGLGAFYSQQTASLLPAVDLEYPLEFYDSSVFQRPFLEASDSGTKTMNLISDTIHCAACVWLIERAVSSLEGVVWVRANLTDKRIRVRWVDDQIDLSSIMKKLADLGYAAMPYEQNIAESKQQLKNKKMLYRIGFSAFTMMNLLWISVAMYTGASGGEYHQYFQWLGFALATPTLFYAGYPFLKNAYIGVKNRFMNMDVPISIGALSTYFYSVYVLFGFSTKGEVYFDTVVNFIFVILIGRYLEASSKKSALSASSSLQQLQPKIALVKSGNTEQLKPIGAIAVGDVVVLKPGERIAVDGMVLSGGTEVDESLLSGEALPVNKNKGDEVFAGTLNTHGSIEIEVTKLSRQTALSQIVDLVESTKMNKSKIVCTIDKIIPYFVWTTLLLATITFIYWYPQGFDLALLSATSVLIITCPCAFGLATPMSIAVASGVAAKMKILIKNGDALEVLSKIKHVVFDKTGTLTLGKFRVTGLESKINRTKFLNIMVSIEKHSEHPLAKAIVDYAGIDNNLSVQEFKTTPGEGVFAKIDSKSYRIGNLNYLVKHSVHKDNTLFDKANALEKQGQTCIWCADEDEILGFVSLSDEVKSDAKAVINELHQMGKTVTMLSGDSQQVAQAVAKHLGIKHVKAQVLPSDKANHIKTLQADGLVLMVGDGINDAPALVQSDSSIAIGSGSDVSVDSADVVVLKNTLAPVIEAITLSKNTQNTIKQNIAFALFYNALMVPLAMMAKVTPLFAAIVMPISSLIVIGNAARLRSKK